MRPSLFRSRLVRLSSTLVAGSTSAPSWTVDATSGKAIPQTAAEVVALFASAGVTIVSGDVQAIYNLGAQTATPITDISGNGRPLSAGANNWTYNQTFTGWTLKSVNVTTLGQCTFVNTTFPNVNANPTTVMLYGAITTLDATNVSTLMHRGNGYDDSLVIEVGTSGVPRPALGAGDGSFRTYGSSVASSSAARPWILTADPSAPRSGLYNDAEALDYAASAANGTDLQIGGNFSNTWNSPIMSLLYCVVVGKTLTKAQSKAVMVAAGWTIPWS